MCYLIYQQNIAFVEFTQNNLRLDHTSTKVYLCSFYYGPQVRVTI